MVGRGPVNRGVERNRFVWSLLLLSSRFHLYVNCNEATRVFGDNGSELPDRMV